MDVFQTAEVVEIRPGRRVRLFHHKVAGNASARLLFCHGSMASMSQYRKCVEYARDRGDCDILAYDWLGCGGSEKPRDWEAYSTPNLLLDLEAAYCRLLQGGSRGTPSILVGHSFGASLVTQFDAETRSAVANDIFECGDSNDSALLPPPSALCLMSTSDGEGLGGGLAVFYLPEFGLRMLQPTMTSAFAKAALHPATNETTQRESLAVSEANEMHVCKAFYRQIQWRDPAAAKCAGPALCIHGDGDGVIPLEQGRQAAAQFEQAAFHVIQQASHQVMEEQPEALGETLKMCTEKVIDYRRVLSRGSSESWSSIWATACEKFCPGRPPLDDALSIVTATVEAACIEIVRERIGDLQLELVPMIDDDSESLEVSAGDAEAEPGGVDARRRSEIWEMQRQSRLRVQHLDEQLGEILGDVAHVRLPGDEALSVGVSSALLEALRERLAVAYEAVRFPEVSSLWPNVSKDGNRAADEFRPWPRQRSSARGAIALDAVLAASAELRDGDDSGASHLRKLLRRASSSGDAELMRRSQEILEDVQQRSDRAYNVWARLVLTPGEGVSTLDAYWRLADDEVSHACGWGSAKFAQKTASVGSEDSKSVPVPVQASAFVFERLAQGARRALEISGGASLMSRSLVIALKTALSEAFMSCYEARTVDFDKMKYSGMSHLLQWLFDLRFLQITLSSSPSSGSSSATATTNKAYEALCQLHDRAEAATLSDPVDRLLYQEVLKSSVKSHVEGVKILLAPFFLYNPRYAFLFQKVGAEGTSNVSTAEDDGFELQTMFGAPLRPMLPQRFPLLPVVSSALAVSSSADLDARLGLSSDSAERAAARMSGANPSAPSVSSLMQSVGSGLGSFGGFGKDSFGGFGKSLTSVWGGTGAVNKPPEAV